MGALKRLREKIDEHPELRVTDSGDSLTIHAANKNGFDITLSESVNEWIVYYEGWHEHFQTAEEALNCLAFGLSNACRLVVSYRGASPVSWTVQSQEDREWTFVSTTALIFRPFWRRPRIEYLQNQVSGRAT